MSGTAALPFDLTPRPALAGRQPLLRNGIRIEAVHGGHVLHVLAKDDAPPALGNAAPLALRRVAPGQWFIVGDKTLSHAETERLAASLKPQAEIVDQSHGRVRLRISGPNAAWVLSKGTAVDLAPTAFPIGASAMTLIGHIGAQITRVAEDSFELTVLRGFADSLWHDLDEMSREFA